jgi:SAM-dependent methyltransferase
MVRWATRLNPGLEFRVGDLRALDLADGSLAGIVAFYSIIHLDPSELAAALRELRRVLTRDGVLLLSFHIGDHSNHLDELFGEPVSLDFHFLQPAAVAAALRSAGFLVTESVEREPYEGAEYPSRRCYLFARAADYRGSS